MSNPNYRSEGELLSELLQLTEAQNFVLAAILEKLQEIAEINVVGSSGYTEEQKNAYLELYNPDMKTEAGAGEAPSADPPERGQSADEH